MPLFQRPALMSRIPMYIEPSFATWPEDPALSAIRANVARRIACVCTALPPEEFAALVDRIARFQRRWEIRETVEREALRALERARSGGSAPGPVSVESWSEDYRPR